MSSGIKWICPKCEWQRYTSYIIGRFGPPSDDFPEESAIVKGMWPLQIFVCDKCSSVFTDPDKFNLVTDLDYDKKSIIRKELKEKYKKEGENEKEKK